MSERAAYISCENNPSRHPPYMLVLLLAATYAVLLPLRWGIWLLRLICRSLRLTAAANKAAEIAPLTT